MYTFRPRPHVTCEFGREVLATRWLPRDAGREKEGLIKSYTYTYFTETLQKYLLIENQYAVRSQMRACISFPSPTPQTPRLSVPDAPPRPLLPRPLLPLPRLPRPNESHHGRACCRDNDRRPETGDRRPETGDRESLSGRFRHYSYYSIKLHASLRKYHCLLINIAG